MQAVRPASVRTLLLVLVMAITLPLLVLSLYLLYGNDSQRRRATDLTAQNLAHSLASASTEFLHNADELLTRVERWTAVTADGSVTCERDVADLHLPAFANVALLALDGSVVCSAKPIGPRVRQPRSDEQWFKTAVDGAKTHLSGPIVGQSSGRWISAFARAIRDTRTGKVAGVLVAGIDLATLPPVMRRLGEPAAAIVGLVDLQGTIVSRSVDPELWIGKRFAPAINQAMFSGAASGNFRTKGVDSIDRIFGFVRVPDQPWIAYAAIPSAPLDSARQKDLLVLCLIALAVTGVAGGATLAISRRISQPMRLLADAARAVACGQGNRQVPIEGPREVHEVALEFNRMVKIRAQAETDLVALAGHCRMLSKRMLELEEDERRRINNELHDQVGQNLSVLNLSLDGVIAMIENRSCEAASSRLREAQNLLQATISQVRDVMADLRPTALDDYGLFVALQGFARSFSARTGLETHVQATGQLPPLGPAADTTLFRIAQEAMVNAAKHARATRLEVRLSSAEGRVALSVADNGIGINPDKAARASTWGLRVMRERAEALDAKLHIEPNSPRGTRVVVELQAMPP